MNAIACTYGVGDTYLVCALMGAYQKIHGPTKIYLQKASHADICEMFGLECYVAASPLFLSPIKIIHPHFMGEMGERFDALTARPDFSQADLYRALLGLPWDAPLAMPKLKDEWVDSVGKRPAEIKHVMLMPHASSWPVPQPVEFWQRLAAALSAAGWIVNVNSGDLPLGRFYALCRETGWVIGTNAGGFQSLVAGEFCAHNTLVVPGPPPGERVQFSKHVWLDAAFPFAASFKFIGRHYDMDEHEIRSEADWQPTIDRIIATGPVGRARHVETVNVPMPRGEFVDRLAVASVKAHRLGGWRAMRDRNRLSDLHNCDGRELAALTAHHLDTWDSVEKAYAGNAEASLLTQQQNRKRLELQALVDDVRPLKSYAP